MRTKQGSKERGKQRGDVLIGLLIALAIMAVLLSVTVPSIVRLQQVKDSNAAAEQLSQIGAAEFAAAQLYGLYLPPAQLTGNLASPIQCSNPMLASGNQIQPPAGYAMTFTPGVSQTSTVSNCATVANGVSAYTLSLNPTNPLQATRYFYTDQTQVIHFAEGRPATVADPIYTVAVPTQGTVSTILTITGATAPTPTPIAPTPPVPTGGAGTYSISSTSNASGPMTGSIAVNGDGSFSGSLSNCSVYGNITPSGAGSTINFSPGGGCSWGGSTFSGSGQFLSGLSLSTVQTGCGGCGQTMNVVGTQ